MDIKQSTAFTLPFVMVDEDNTELTGLTVTVEISKAGGAFAAAAGVVSEISDGWYAVALTAVDTGTLGALAVRATATGALQQNLILQVVRYSLTDLAAMFIQSLTRTRARSTTAITEVYEGTTSYLTVAFLDADDEAAMPTTVTWQCHDIKTGEELQAEASVTPDTSVTITIPPSVNTLVDQYHLKETHRVTIKATYGVDDQVTGKYDFIVVGLGAI